MGRCCATNTRRSGWTRALANRIASIRRRTCLEEPARLCGSVVVSRLGPAVARHADVVAGKRVTPHPTMTVDARVRAIRPPVGTAALVAGAVLLRGLPADCRRDAHVVGRICLPPHVSRNTRVAQVGYGCGR